MNAAAVGAIVIVILLASLIIMSLKFIRLVRGTEPRCACHVRNDWMFDAPAITGGVLLLSWIILDYDGPWDWSNYLFTALVAGNVAATFACVVLTNRYLVQHSERQSCERNWPEDL